MGKIFSKKKGVLLGDLTPIIIVLIVAGVVVGIGAEVTTEVADSSTRDSLTVTNESTALTAFGTNYTLDMYGGGDKVSITKIANATTVIGSGNYTSNKFGIVTLYNHTPGGLNHSAGTYNISYTYDRYLAAWWAAQNATEGSNKIAKWMPTIGMVVAAAIIIGIVFRSFATRARE